MTHKALYAAILLCGLILCALVARNGQLLLLAIPFLIYLIVGLVQSPERVALRATRALDRPEAYAGEPVRVRVEAENTGEPLPDLWLADIFPPGMQASGPTWQHVSLARGASTEIEYAVTAPRGSYEWNSIVARASDPLGLFEVTREIEAHAQVRVRPAAAKISPLAMQPRATLHSPGPTPARLAGSGTDFWGIREYRPGDARRHINWRLAGRYPRRLFTNEFRGEEIADFGLIVDARAITSDEQLEKVVFEASIQAAAALAENLLHSGNRVSLVVFGERSSSLFPGYGKRQLAAIVADLCHATLGRNLPFRYMEYFPTRVFPPQSTVILFSALDARDIDTYARLRAYGYDVVLVSPDTVEVASRVLKSTHANELARRTARVERVAHLRTLLKIGVEVVDWQINKPLDPLLQRAVRAMVRRRAL